MSTQLQFNIESLPYLILQPKEQGKYFFSEQQIKGFFRDIQGYNSIFKEFNFIYQKIIIKLQCV